MYTKQTTPRRSRSIDQMPLSDAANVPDKEAQAAGQGTDSKLVTWEGEHDDDNPHNWSSLKIWTNVSVISLISFITPLTSSMFAPAVPQIMSAFHSTSGPLSTFMISIYVVGFALGPLLAAPLSEIYGRLVIYHVSNVLFLCFTLGCALSTSLAMFIVFRFLSGCAGATPLVLGGGTISDIIPPARRGAAMTVWGIGQLFGPVIGPVAGGFLNEAAGWRWIFWTIEISGGLVVLIGFLVLRETFEPVLLERKAARLRKETGDPELRSESSYRPSPGRFWRNALILPLRLLFTSPIVFLLGLDVSIVYGYLYLVFSTLTPVFEKQYGFNSGSAGLCFLALGVGMFVGLFAVGIASDKIAASKVAHGITIQPEHRLPPLFLSAFLIPIGLFWYGWSLEAHIHWIMPLTGTAIFGAGVIITFIPLQIYLIDAFEKHAASALAGASVPKFVLGATLPLAGPGLYAALGQGWGNSLLAFIALLLTPVPLALLKWGPWLRSRN